MLEDTKRAWFVVENGEGCIVGEEDISEFLKTYTYGVLQFEDPMIYPYPSMEALMEDLEERGIL